LEAIPIAIRWHDDLPIFASEPFLKAVSDTYGWLGGIDDSGKLRCILPYTIVRKASVRMVRFRIETIVPEGKLEIDQETAFLNSAMRCLRAMRADVVIPATTNAIFQTYPDEATAAPYGSYVIDLCREESEIWSGIDRTYRKNIRSAQKNGVRILSGEEHLRVAYQLVRETFSKSHLPFMKFPSFEKYVAGLTGHVRVLIAEHEGIAQSCVVFPYSNYCAYAVYGGNIERPYPGSMKLLIWEAIRQFREVGVRRFDFVGARINPAKGSKHEGINSFKRSLGGHLSKGFMWKCDLNPIKSSIYSIMVRLIRGGDIVDHECHKLTYAKL
jgi:hypothetical protein